MRTHQTTKAEIHQRMELCGAQGIPYKYKWHGNSIMLIVGGVCYYCYTATKNENGVQVPNKLPVKEIGFIGKVKKHINAEKVYNKVKPNYRDKDKIKYIDWNRSLKVGEQFKKCHCVDINTAYWDSAYNLGLINKTLYIDGLTKDKRIRLASLGSFAKVVKTIAFDGVKEKMLPNVEPKYPHIFFNCANDIYKTMDACKTAIGNDFLFYWTDCIYVKTAAARDKVHRILKQHKFKGKNETVAQVRFVKGIIKVEGKKGQNKDYGLNLDE